MHYVNNYIYIFRSNMNVQPSLTCEKDSQVIPKNSGTSRCLGIYVVKVVS